MRALKSGGHMLGGNALVPSPAVLRGQQKNLSGLIMDVEKRSRILSSGSKKKLPLYQNRQHLAHLYLPQ